MQLAAVESGLILVEPGANVVTCKTITTFGEDLDHLGIKQDGSLTS